MSERRNLIGGLGVAVMALGLAALLSYAVALGAQSKPFDWGAPITIASLVVMAVGAVLLGAVLYRFYVLGTHRAAIAEFVGRGNVLLDGYQVPGAMKSSPTEAEWVAEVQAWLDKNMKYYRSHFDNLADPRDSVDFSALLTGTQGPNQLAKREDVDKSIAEDRLRKRLLRLKDMMTGWG